MASKALLDAIAFPSGEEREDIATLLLELTAAEDGGAARRKPRTSSLRSTAAAARWMRPNATPPRTASRL